MLAIVDHNRNTIMVGDKVRILEMNGEPQYTNKEGIVEFIDSMRQIHGTWGGCAIIPEIDKFEKVE